MLSSLDFLLVFITLILFIYGVYKRSRLWRIGKPEDRSDRKPERFKRLWRDGILQIKILSERTPGLMHLFLFWGFLIPLVIIILLNLRLDLYLPEWLSAVVSIVLDLCGLAALIGIAIAFYRRFIQKLEQLDRQPEDAIVQGIIFLIILSGLMVEGLRMSIASAGNGVWSPIGWLIGIVFRVFDGENVQANIHQIVRRIHLFLVLGFIAYLPYSKLRHIFTSPLNIYFASLKPKGELSKMDIENAETFGVASIKDFTWKQILDLDACTKCGRCQMVCPAHQTEKPLSPKKVILDLKKHWQIRGKEIVAASGNGKVGEEFMESEIIGKVITEDTIWACTTCRACMEECPVMIEHIDKIVDLRREQVLMASVFPSELQQTFRGMENNFNPWGIGFSNRADWAEGLNIKNVAEDKDIDILWFVGCAGSYDDRAKKVSRAFANIMKAAGINFGILGAEEKCCGETARRLGNEYLAQTLMEMNVELFNELGIKKIVTCCPHCYNTFKNEYPQFNGNYEVYHHTEFMAELIKSGKIKLQPGNGAKITFHDSCYLGRYNDIYEEPRFIMNQVYQNGLIEIPNRNQQKGFCCGAGGGRMWLDETIGKRIYQMRTEQIIETGAQTAISACPYCLTMITDGIKDKELTDQLKVMDIAEMVEEKIVQT